MVNTFSAAQVRAAKIAADLEMRLKRMHRDCTPAEAVMAFALMATRFDTQWKFNPKNPRACRDLLIVACGGVNAIDWNALQALPEAPSDRLDAPGEVLTDPAPSSAPSPDSL